MITDAILYNPTNEEMRPMVGGKPYFFPPGKKMMVNGKVANHIINEYGKRGMVTLNYGDNTTKKGNKTIEEIKAENGRRLNLEFKRQMVIRMNQLNEANKQEGKKYIKPGETIKQYAKELGIDLLSPYTVANAQTAEIADLRKKNEELMEIIDSQKTQTEQLMEMVKKLTDLKEDEIPLDPLYTFKKERREKFIKLGRTRLEKYVEENREEIGTWPDDLFEELKRTWKMKTTKRFPI